MISIVKADGGFTAMGGARPYQGSAWYYAEYRQAMSDQFSKLLATSLGWTSNDRIIDLGTGPGPIAIRLAPHVGEVVAVDPEPDMLAEGVRRAAAAGATNVRFVEGSSDRLGCLGIPSGQYRAVTIGSAFHWMVDQDRVLGELDGYLHPSDGSVAIVSYDIGRPAISKTDADIRPWWERTPWTGVPEVLERYLADVPEGPHPAGRHDPFPDILGRSAFPRLRFLRYEYETLERPRIAAAIGFHYSLSHVLSRLGDRQAALEAEQAELLGDAHDSPVASRQVDSALIALRHQQVATSG